jgi:hypothetical protein
MMIGIGMPMTHAMMPFMISFSLRGKCPLRQENESVPSRFRAQATRCSAHNLLPSGSRR